MASVGAEIMLRKRSAKMADLQNASTRTSRNVIFARIAAVQANNLPAWSIKLSRTGHSTADHRQSRTIASGHSLWS